MQKIKLETFRKMNKGSTDDEQRHKSQDVLATPMKSSKDNRTMIQKISRVLQIWTMVSTHMRVRDRSVKTLQYGCQMLIGYYGSQLNETMRDTLAFTRRTCSNARKAFWLLKSINHIDSCMTMMMKLMDGTNQLTTTAILDVIEQIFLVLYYAYENIVFFTRVKLLTSVTEKDVDTFGNWSWFIGDFACFVAALLRFYDHFLRWLRIKFYDQVTGGRSDAYSIVNNRSGNNRDTASQLEGDRENGGGDQKWYYQRIYEELFCDELGTALTDSFTTVIIVS